MSKLQKTYNFIIETRQRWRQHSLRDNSEREELSSIPNTYNDYQNSNNLIITTHN